MAGATALLALATLACAFAPSFGALVALRALQGALVPGMTAVSVAYAGDRFRERALPEVVAGVIAASVVGGLVGRVRRRPARVREPTSGEAARRPRVRFARGAGRAVPSSPGSGPRAATRRA
jgi:hypothetical protein